MRNLFFSLIITVMAFKINAQEKQDFDFKCASIITSHNMEVVEYKFKSFEDLDLGLDEIIEELDFSGKERKESCKMTITIRLEMLFGIATGLISESITTSCNDENAGLAAKKLKKILVAIAMK